MEQFIAAIRQLPEGEQDALAARYLEELEDDRRWDESLEISSDKLATMAAKVRQDIREGRTRETDWDQL